MAVLKFGTLIAGARGTIGGAIFSAGAAGPFARIYARGSNPRSRKQSNDRLRLSLQPAAWRALSGAQRSAWSTWAALPQQTRTNPLGESYNPTAWQAFVMINVRLLRAGRSQRSDPPDDPTPAPPVIDDFIFEDSGGSPLVRLDYDPAQFPSGMDILAEGWAGTGTTRAAQYSGFRILVVGLASPTGEYVMTPEWRACFGTPLEGQQAIMRVYRQTDEGVRSAPATLRQVYTL